MRILIFLSLEHWREKMEGKKKKKKERGKKADILLATESLGSRWEAACRAGQSLRGGKGSWHSKS